MLGFGAHYMPVNDNDMDNEKGRAAWLVDQLLETAEMRRFWEALGRGSVPDTAQRAVDLLNQAGIPVLVTGGLAVLAHGYPALTVDVDLIVPNLEQAHEILLRHGYQASLCVLVGVIDPESRIRVDILPGGKSLTPRCPVDFPVPTEMGFHYVGLTDLISLKLGSYTASPARRGKDRTAVEELIIRASLPRDLPGIHASVMAKYREIWDAIQAESPGPQA